MQDPNADTEWNDVLRSKGIIPPREESGLTEDDIIGMVEQTIDKKTQGKNYDEMDLDELDDLEDDINEDDERAFEAYRKQRLAEMQATQASSQFGNVNEITKADWVQEVNKAGDGIWVVLHIYAPSVPECKLMEQHLSNLALKFPQTKFLKGMASLCIPNYPDKNVPTIFVYYEGDMKKQWVGKLAFGGMNCKQDDLEWMLFQIGAVKSEMEEKPRKEINDVLNSAIKQSTYNSNSDDDNDW